MTPRYPGLRRFAWVLMLLSVTLYLCVSAITLAHLGVPYDLPGGSPLVKLHPGTLMMALALAVGLVAWGHPLQVLIDRLRRMPLVATYLACMMLVAAWSVWRNGISGAAFIVDSLWMPGVALLVLGLYSSDRHRKLLLWVLLLVGLNAVIGLVEYALKTSLVPRYLSTTDLIADAGYFRSSALLGHPLSNALITVSLMPAALLLPPRLGWPLLATLALALLAFGSRTAMAVAALVYAPLLLAYLAWRAAQGSYSYRQLMGGMLGLMLACTALVATVWLSGLGERIFANLRWDNSANVRLLVWDALDHLNDNDWWVGVSPARIEEIAARIGIDLRYEALENFWIVLLMQLGLLGFTPFLIGLAAGVWHVWRVAAAPMRLAVLCYFLVASGANTLASKSVSLTLLFVVMLGSAAWVQARPPTERGLLR